jgi:hypothetical protein
VKLGPYERLGMRSSTGAFLTLLVSFAGAAFLLLVVRAILVVRGTNAELVFGQFGADVVAVGASTGSTLDGLAGIVVTVLLGFVVVVKCS